MAIESRLKRTFKAIISEGSHPLMARCKAREPYPVFGLVLFSLMLG